MQHTVAMTGHIEMDVAASAFASSCVVSKGRKGKGWHEQYGKEDFNRRGF